MKHKSELDEAYKHLTVTQMGQVENALNKGGSISSIACKLGLTRSFVHSYVRRLNGVEEQKKA